MRSNDLLVASRQGDRIVDVPGTATSESKIWSNSDGLLHRLDGPAIERADGRKEWWINGKRHRVDGPAVHNPSGLKSWWVNGQLHRTDGPAVEWSNGTKEWYFNGTKYDYFTYWIVVNGASAIKHQL